MAIYATKNGKIVTKHNGKILTNIKKHEATSAIIARISEIIDGQLYDAVKIGKLYWTTSNYIPSWEPINASNGNNNFCWYNGVKLASNTETRKRGIYVRNIDSSTEANIISNYIGNWRVPTYNDYLDLRTAIGGITNGWKLLSKNAIGYDTFELTNEFGFNLMNYGIGGAKYPFTGSYEWKQDGKNYAFMCINLGLKFIDTDNTTPAYAYIDRDTGYEGKFYTSWYAVDKLSTLRNQIPYVPIRLCRDA